MSVSADTDALIHNGSGYCRSVAAIQYLNDREWQRRLIKAVRWRVPSRSLCGRAARDRRSLWKPARSAGDSTARGSRDQRGAERHGQPARSAGDEGSDEAGEV